MGKTTQRVVGDLGEQRACEWLTAHGFVILGRNVTTPYGEIDIIAKKGRVVHFIEVKTRETHQVGFAVEAAMGKKLEKSIRSAHLIASLEYPNVPISLDILSSDAGTIRFFENVTL